MKILIVFCIVPTIAVQLLGNSLFLAQKLIEKLEETRETQLNWMLRMEI